MTATLHADGLSASRGERTLFSGLDLVVAPGDVIGLVGANGAGKSTLLSILSRNPNASRARVSRDSSAGARASPGPRRR
jgi:ATPase subunit of ABC transporter with duplicated ATPase domains